MERRKGGSSRTEGGRKGTAIKKKHWNGGREEAMERREGGRGQP